MESDECGCGYCAGDVGLKALWHQAAMNGVKGDPVMLPSGMNRESEDGKIDYLLVRDGPMYRRWAVLMTAAVSNRGRQNWMRANSADDLERFRRGAARHFEQWLDGEDDEDHAAALIFNVNGVEYLRDILS